MDFPSALAFYAVFLFSISFHEFAHAFVARKLGDSTAADNGFLSMHPLLHIKKEPFGMLVFPLISIFTLGWPFGYSSVPADLHWVINYPKKASWVAFAGPLVNLIVVILTVFIAHIGIFAGFFSPPESINFTTIIAPNCSGICSAAAKLLSLIFTVNLLSFVLNMIPLPPLDGSKFIARFFSDQKAQGYLETITNPSFGFIGLFLAWKIFDPLFDLVFLFLINLIYPGVSYS